MKKELKRIQMILVDGIRISKQSSYARRAPSSEAIPLIEEARKELKAFVSQHPQDQEGWTLLAQAEECLMRFSEARKCLQQAMDLSGQRRRNDLKKMALYTELESEWKNFLLTPVQLRELGHYLRLKLSVHPPARNFQWTEKWLRANGFEDTTNIIESIQARGAFDDFQVSENLARG